LLAFADELADLRDKNVDQTLNKTKKLSKGAAESKKFERNILTSNKTVPSGSGGIDTSKLSRGVSSGTKLQGIETTKVESEIEKVAMANKGKVTASSGNKPKRSLEEVSIVFDRNKGAIYSLYNRALRKDPTIAGKIVFEITIASDGSVVDVKLVSSELGNASLERKLLVKIKTFLFEPKSGADNLVVTYPLDFVPS
jgi:protein TonB